MGGFFGTIKHSDCINDLFYGTDYNFHMGTKRGGMIALSNDNLFIRKIHSIENSYFRTKFEDDLPNFSGNSGIGIISDTDPQPIMMHCHLGRFVLVTVARINNLKALEKEFLEQGKYFSEHSSGTINQTEFIAMLINEGKTFVEGIENVFKKIKGSCSMLILTENGIIAARDKLGRTSILLAKGSDGYAVSSETCSFPNLGYELEYTMGPGEIIHITADGYTQLRKPNDKMQICAFLWVYYGFPVCTHENCNVDEMRYICGCEMGKTDNDIQPDFVSGIPDSGIGMAVGYAVGRKIPYRSAIVKYTPTWPRSFMPIDKKRRELVAKMKLIANRNMLKNKSVVFCDDSIVRGNQLKDNIKDLYRYGAKEVHIRISCPPILYQCNYLNFTSSQSEMDLITRRVIRNLENNSDENLKAYININSPEYNRMIETIRTTLNADSLKFNSLETLVKAIGLPKEKICTHCFDGSSYY